MTDEQTTPAAEQPAPADEPKPTCCCVGGSCGGDEDTAPEPDFKPFIEFDDFLKVDLRVGTIVEAALHPNADKLLVLQVDLGCETRQILAGIKAWYAPEDLVGKQVTVCCNLKPRKMRGLESAGMIVAASGNDREDVVVLCPDRPMPAGASCS